jgi:glycosyltransferase involved in cell wall biosynthesis
LEAIENVRQQTYRPLEHVIVSDGPDERLSQLAYDATANVHDLDVTFQELGHHWSGFLAASEAAVPFQVAQWLARGEYLVWMADDERFDPEHIASLVDLLESTDSDFVYSWCRLWHRGTSPDQYTLIGTDPPTYGNVTNVLYRRELLDYRGFRTHVGSGTDWDQVLYWVEVGARWAMLPHATMSHRADKAGEGPGYRALRQPLRGQRSERQRRL